MASAGVRIGIVGATGALGSEVLAALSASSLRVREILPIGTDRSLGEEVEFQDELYPVECDEPSLRGLDLVFLCAPIDASLEYARAALRQSVPCIDLSGALVGSPEVPVLAEGLPMTPDAIRSPAIATPGGAALAWARVLHPLHRENPLRRVTGTLMDGASVGGRSGIESLYSESMAVFNQQDLPDPEVFGLTVAFDCMPDPTGAEASEAASPREERLIRTLGRLLGEEVRIGVTAVQVPAFVGHAAALVVESDVAWDPARAAEILAKSHGVEVWQGGGPGPNLRSATGRTTVIVGQPRRDPSGPGGLLLWLVVDVLSTAAADAVALATTRLNTH